MGGKFPCVAYWSLRGDVGQDMGGASVCPMHGEQLIVLLLTI